MPGFNIQSDGRDQKNAQAEPRRKHRWLITDVSVAGRSILTVDELVYLEKAARPTFKYENVEMHHDQEVINYAGKQSWEPITLSWYDIEQPAEISEKLGQWIQSITENWFNAGAKTTVALPSAYKSTVTLQVRDGQGEPTETWKIYNAWPESTNWNELDYTTSDILRIEVTMRYDRAEQQRGAGV